jgi:hypothetical protein
MRGIAAEVDKARDGTQSGDTGNVVVRGIARQQTAEKLPEVERDAGGY